MSRCLGLDVGDKTIGVAVSDPLGFTAQGLETVKRRTLADDLKRLNELAKEYETKLFVVGLPKNMNGTQGERCEAVRDFAAKMQEKIPACEVAFWDERLSTVAAERSLLEADLSRKKRRRVIDKMAAVFILQGFLDSQGQPMS